MSRNKDLRKQLEGQRRALGQHRSKLEAELRRAAPNEARIEGWRHTIRNVEAVIARLERRLRR